MAKRAESVPKSVTEIAGVEDRDGGELSNTAEEGTDMDNPIRSIFFRHSSVGGTEYESFLPSTMTPFRGRVLGQRAGFTHGER